ncbi:MAG TPA: NAD(P)/FAD-dependent oxidoreductase [Candidatus Stackebrandtia excrementipullorum]|nr:NAD(P)/FAD-dependent oxidoreductase [Candidatus Stackebrandtia excrementipullorum]
MDGNFDVIVVGGGHNGLVAAAYLAKAGLKVCVCEAREVVGGAAVSEHPFGPAYTVTSLSYVVSLLPPALIADLNLTEHGYHVYAQGPYFAPRADGRYLSMPSDPAERFEQISKFSQRDAETYDDWDARMARLGDILGPLLERIPPKIGSKRPGDLLKQAGLIAGLRDVDVRTAGEITRLLTSSMADVIEDDFESDALRGLLSVSGCIGTWAGPRSAGTAYVMLHHHVGDLDGTAGAWGFPRGGMGGVTQALARSARAFGAKIRTLADVARINVKDGRVTGVSLENGDELRAPSVITTVHPSISFLKLIEATELPTDFLTDVKRWKSRSGTVKINLVVDRLPSFTAHPQFDPQIHGGTIVLAESLDDLENAYQEAVAGRAARVPFADVCIPSVFDDTLAPPGEHVVSMFTQWVPHTWADEPDAEELSSYAARVIARMDAVAPGFTDSIQHQQVIGPHEMQRDYRLTGGNIFHGELTPGQMFHTRPVAGYADLRTPIAGLYQAGSSTHGGGGVTGIPGRNVVSRVLSDRRWWRKG